MNARLKELSAELKALIIDACEKDVLPAAITDEEPLFGPQAPLALDSLDALQVAMAIQKRYGLRLTDSKETRRIMSSVGNLAERLASHLAPRS